MECPCNGWASLLSGNAIRRSILRSGLQLEAQDPPGKLRLQLCSATITAEPQRASRSPYGRAHSPVRSSPISARSLRFGPDVALARGLRAQPPGEGGGAPPPPAWGTVLSASGGEAGAPGRTAVRLAPAALPRLRLLPRRRRGTPDGRRER